MQAKVIYCIIHSEFEENKCFAALGKGKAMVRLFIIQTGCHAKSWICLLVQNIGVCEYNHFNNKNIYAGMCTPNYFMTFYSNAVLRRNLI